MGNGSEWKVCTALISVCMHVRKDGVAYGYEGRSTSRREKARGFDVYLYPFGEGIKKEKEQLQLRLVRDELVREQ